MHVCIVCNEYPPSNHGGIGSFTKDLAEALVKKGIQVTVVGVYIDAVLKLEKAIDEVINNVRVIRIPFEKTFSFMPFNTINSRFKLYSFIKELNKKSKIHVIEAPGGSGWFPLGTPSKIPLISRLHGGEVYTAFQLNKRVSKIIKFFEKCQLQKSTKIVSVSKYTADTIFKLLNIKKEFSVIYNSVDSTLFDKSSIKFDEGLIIFAGTVKKAKGIEELIQSMNTVFHQSSKASLVVAGKIPDLNGESYEIYLRSFLKKEYQSRVKFLGILNREKELIPLLAKAELCCFPSYVESFSLAPLEAMSLGKAVVFTELTSGPEAISHGVNGLLCNPKKPIDISEKILMILEDETLRSKLETNAKSEIKNRFSFEEWMNQNINLYNNIMETK